MGGHIERGLLRPTPRVERTPAAVRLEGEMCPRRKRKPLNPQPDSLEPALSQPIHSRLLKVNPKEAPFITLLRACHDSVWSLRRADRNHLR